MTYTNVHISEKFGISREAARQWANQFSKYLSPSANPEQGRQRNYDDDDLAVFALVASMKAGGAKMAEIFAALESGQRGSVPVDSQIVPRSDAGINAVRRELMLKTQEAEALRTELLMTQGENRLLKVQLEQKEQRIEGLYVQLAMFKAKE